MKTIVAVLCLIAAATAAPKVDEDLLALRKLPALKHTEIHDEFGQYIVHYETADGTVVSRRGYLVARPDGKGYVMVQEGETSYIGDDGKRYVTKFKAGLDGVQMEGNHLPTSVPVSVSPFVPLTLSAFVPTPVSEYVPESVPTSVPESTPTTVSESGSVQVQ